MHGTGLGTAAVVLQGENKYGTEVNYMLSYVVNLKMWAAASHGKSEAFFFHIRLYICI